MARRSDRVVSRTTATAQTNLASISPPASLGGLPDLGRATAGIGSHAATNAENAYDYALQDPINRYDPAGSDVEDDNLAGASYAIGGGGVGGGVGSADLVIIDSEEGPFTTGQLTEADQQFDNYGSKSIRKGIRSLQRLIENHETRIRVGMRTGDTRAIAHWQAEIRNWQGQINARLFVLRYGPLS